MVIAFGMQCNKKVKTVKEEVEKIKNTANNNTTTETKMLYIVIIRKVLLRLMPKKHCYAMMKPYKEG